MNLHDDRAFAPFNDCFDHACAFVGRTRARVGEVAFKVAGVVPSRRRALVSGDLSGSLDEFNSPVAACSQYVRVLLLTSRRVREDVTI